MVLSDGEARAERELAPVKSQRRGSEKDLLAVCEAHAVILGMRHELAEEVKRRRIQRRMSQATLAKAIGSSQSRIAKMESGDPSASLELLVRALVATGGRPRISVE